MVARHASQVPPGGPIHAGSSNPARIVGRGSRRPPELTGAADWRDAVGASLKSWRVRRIARAISIIEIARLSIRRPIKGRPTTAQSGERGAISRVPIRMAATRRRVARHPRRPRPAIQVVFATPALIPTHGTPMSFASRSKAGSTLACVEQAAGVLHLRLMPGPPVSKIPHHEVIHSSCGRCLPVHRWSRCPGSAGAPAAATDDAGAAGRGREAA